MMTCSTCHTIIVFGGVSLDNLSFCSADCRQKYVTLRRGEQEYQESLHSLRQDPSNPDIKQAALAAGRAYAALTREREGFGITVFDEVALSNDIQAACAAGHGPIASSAGSLTVEERLQRLQTLHLKGLLSAEEYQMKRSELLKAL